MHARNASLLSALVLALAACAGEPKAAMPAGEGGSSGSASSGGGAGGAGGTSGAGGAGGAGGRAGTGDAGGDASATHDAGPDATRDANADDAGGVTPEMVWSELSVMAIVDPLDHGAIGDGVADDLDALDAAVNALPEAGGIVFLRPGKTFLKNDLLIITKDHVKLWAPNRQATLQQHVGGVTRKQSILCRNEGCGFFGLALRSDATARFDALEDNQISADHGALVEVVGCEIDSSAAAGVFLYGSREHYIHGNFIHHTWADHIHHTDGARESWVFRNAIFNEAPSNGDDGIACVTYGVDSPRCADMEWWSNTVLRTGHGRGYAVIGGEDIEIHDNYALDVAGAGIIVASEGGYDSASSTRITARDNVVYQCGHSVGGHPGILVSGYNDAAEPLSELTFTDNVSVDNPSGPYREEGEYTGVTNDGLLTAASDLPSPLPTLEDVVIEDTSVLRTRDVSHVPEGMRAGLHRIHVRVGGEGFEQRFEYAVRGEPDAIEAFASAREAAGGYVAAKRVVGGTGYALVLTAQPIEVGAGLAGVSFRELRAGAGSELGWLWQRIDQPEE